MMTTEEMDAQIAASRRRIWQGWLGNVADGRRYETEMSGQEGPNTWVNYRDKGSLRLVTVWYTTKSGEPFMLIDLQGKEVYPS